MIDRLEQRRRDLQRDEPELYAYISATEQIKAYDAAGDLASGATSGEAAANRVWRRGRALRQTLSDAAIVRQRVERRTSADRP